MPYIPHIRLSWGGGLGTGTPTESWVCSMSIGGEGTDATLVPPAASELDAIVSALSTFHGATGTKIATVATLQFVKAAFVDTAGHYVGEAQYRALASLPGGTGVTTNLHPLQISKVVTLHTGKRGPANRGRFYLPAPIHSLSTDGLISASDASATATTAQTLLNAINAAIPGAARVVVASSKGYNSTVTGVTVGRTLDTVRTRRKSVSELYAADVAITP